MYQEVCKVYIVSGIIKDMKIDLRKKWKKVVSVFLDTNIYWDLINKLDTSLIYRNLQFHNSQIWILAHDDLDC